VSRCLYFIQDNLSATIFSDAIFGFGGPNKRSRIDDVMLNIRFDCSYQFGDRFKNSTPNALVGYIAEPTLDQVEPEAGSRHKAQIEPRVAPQPRLDLHTLK